MINKLYGQLFRNISDNNCDHGNDRMCALVHYAHARKLLPYYSTFYRLSIYHRIKKYDSDIIRSPQNALFSIKVANNSKNNSVLILFDERNFKTSVSVIIICESKINSRDFNVFVCLLIPKLQYNSYYLQNVTKPHIVARYLQSYNR